MAASVTTAHGTFTIGEKVKVDYSPRIGEVVGFRKNVNGTMMILVKIGGFTDAVLSTYLEKGGEK